MRYSIPTPTISAVSIGPITLHFYAICIILGVAFAIWLGNLRFTAVFPEGDGVVGDVAVFAVPAGVIGGRIYHVITTPEDYFGKSGHIFNVFKVWNGGLGIWGAVLLGTCVAFFSYRSIGRKRQLPSFSLFADALAPALLAAQAIGRWGNWFNGELFGRPLTAPWALDIPLYLRPEGFEKFATFHPTFAYESLWCAIIAIALLALSNRLSNRLPAGSIFILYIFLYSVGRFFIEGLRIDQAHVFAGLRLNQYVALLTAAGSAIAFTRNVKSRR